MTHIPQATVDETLEQMRTTERQLTAERVGLAELRTEREVPRELAIEMDQYNAENRNSAAVIFWLAWLMLFGVGLGLLGLGGFLRDLRFGAVGLAVMLLLVAAARRMWLRG